MPGTTLKDASGRVVYTPPQGAGEIEALMTDLERFMNSERPFEVDPLVRMALIQHQFESIPFHDGNGRAGRIINVLYLVKEGRLDIPVLYLSQSIVRTKSEYYRLLQAVRDHDVWEEWVLYMLQAVEETAREGGAMVKAIHAVQFLEEELGVSRITATRYLNLLADGGILERVRVGRDNFYINVRLVPILTGT